MYIEILYHINSLFWKRLFYVCRKISPRFKSFLNGLVFIVPRYLFWPMCKEDFQEIEEEYGIYAKADNRIMFELVAFDSDDIF